MNQAGRVAPEYNEKERSRMKLYFKPTSPYARKVRVVAVEAGLIDRITTEEPPLRDAPHAERFTGPLKPIAPF